MKKVNLFLASSLFVIIVVVVLHAQPPEVEWERFYGGDSIDKAYSVQQTTDGGYIFAGESNSFNGWHHSYFYLVKTDSQGNIMWSNTYGGIAEETAYSVQQTSDRGYILAGSTTTYGAGYRDCYVVKTDSLGDSLWTRTYGGSYQDYAYSVQQTTDGGYIIAGQSYLNSDVRYDIYLIKTDSLGNQVWCRTYGNSGHDSGECVRQTTDGGYIVAGYTWISNSLFYEACLIKTDGQGNPLWTRTYGGEEAESDYAYSVQQTTDGGYIVAGYTESFGAGEYDMYLLKTDSMGDTLWTHTYGGSYNDIAYSVQQNSDGEYILVGSTRLYYGGDLYVVKVDICGNMLWALEYGGTDWDVGYCVDLTRDGGYIVAGYTPALWYEIPDCWLVKIAPDTFTYHPHIQVSDSLLDFSMVPVTEDSSQELAIYNTGNAWLVVYDLTTSDSSFFTDFNHADSLIAPSDSLAVLVTFTPRETIPYHDTLYIDNNDQPTEVLLSGVGTPPDPEIIVSDSSLDFGTVAMREDSTKGLTIYSTGNVPLIIHDIATSEQSFTTDFDPSDSLIVSGDSLEILVTFAPWDTIFYSETLTIDNNDELMEVALLGIGLPPNAVALEPPSKMPTTYALNSVYPNPFNTQATIRYDIPVHGLVRINVYDVLGREVAHLVDGVVQMGTHSVLWDAGDLPSGIYFCRMNSGDFNQIRKILLLK